MMYDADIIKVFDYDSVFSFKQVYFEIKAFWK